MNRLLPTLTLLSAALWIAPAARAEVAIETVIVGNPGNLPDQSYAYNNPEGLQLGSVPYAYRIGRYEVTNSQYAEFLNAKAQSDPLLLYHISMGSDPAGGITRSGADGNFTYAARENMGNKPVNYVSFNDAIRFINWLQNGQGDGDTETGTYTIGESYPGGYPVNPAAIVRSPGAAWFLPTEQEWYKAAFHDPRTEAQGGPPGDDHYWLYPTQSDLAPTAATANAVGDISNPGANVANFDYNADWNGQDGNVTTVGSAGPLSASYYGTSDQGGNVWEWNETLFEEAGRGLRGGAWNLNPYNMPANMRHYAKIATGSYPGIGFRVALALVLGDANGDGVVDDDDYACWLEHYLQSSQDWASGDFNGDGVVDAADYTLWADSYAPGEAIANTPEPGSLALALLGAAGLFVIRKRLFAG